MVHIDGSEEIKGAKTFSGGVFVKSDIEEDNNTNQLATTKWTNEKIQAARGRIPLGGEDAEPSVQIWVE